MLIGISDRIPYIVDIALFIERADRTGNDALSASYAAGRVQPFIKGRTYTHVETAADLADRADLLHVVAGGDAAQALDALVVVAHYIRRGIVDLILGFVILEVIFVDAVIISQLLQLAVISPYAGKTFLVVRGKDQLKRRLSGSADSRSVGQYFKPFFNGIGACGGESAPSLDLHHTDAAGADAVDILEITQRGDLNIYMFGSLQDSRALRNGDRNVVDL